MKVVTLITSFLLFQFLSPEPNPTPSTVCLSSEEQKLYELIQEYRASKKLKSIPLSGKLSLVAQTHARDLSENYKIDFDNKNKCNPHSWSTKGKWSPCCYTNDHKQAQCMWDKPKEIADYKSPGYEIAYYNSIAATAKEGLDGWKTSPGHNPLLINDGMWSKVEWKAIGIGIYKEHAVVWFGQLEDQTIPKLCSKE
jgi:uncharacterized protein YkwD